MQTFLLVSKDFWKAGLAQHDSSASPDNATTMPQMLAIGCEPVALFIKILYVMC